MIKQNEYLVSPSMIVSQQLKVNTSISQRYLIYKLNNWPHVLLFSYVIVLCAIITGKNIHKNDQTSKIIAFNKILENFVY